MASDDGVNYRLVKQLVPARQGWQNTDENSTHSIPPTTARFFRFYWTPEGSEPGSEDMDAAKWKPNLKIKRITPASGSPSEPVGRKSRTGMACCSSYQRRGSWETGLLFTFTSHQSDRAIY